MNIIVLVKVKKAWTKEHALVIGMGYDQGPQRACTRYEHGLKNQWFSKLGCVLFATSRPARSSRRELGPEREGTYQ